MAEAVNQIPGVAQLDLVIASERLYHTTNEGFEFCLDRCMTHYAEDSIPYHYGEKTCLDRCLAKVDGGMRMAVAAKKDFEKKLKAGEMPYQWMRDAEQGKIQ
ncbi:hypothetical protein STCU_02999 [Strigomonas culicis]|uniref:Tim10-like domain-containing protein n=1 Tax=Strigomonas culicis TaxID=28005 RepID=S9W7S1_9TRYP|nr:hypothetical protein STCU_02999 [Strigomonas culicis]|eukprot:EPY32055.1 hypothetical protein STCU_02999 [Strigomonas culicis]